MTCSLHIYRQRIGTYQPTNKRKKAPWKKTRCTNSRTLSFRTRLILTLLMTNYLMILFYLPLILKPGPNKQDYNQDLFITCKCTVPNPPKLQGPSQSKDQVQLVMSRPIELLLANFVQLPYCAVSWNYVGLSNTWKSVEPGTLTAASVFI